MLSVCILSIVSVNADTHYVRPINPGAQAPYTNWANAATSIQDAVNAASDGDTVLVTNGTYVLTGQISVASGVVVRSVNGWASTTVDGNYPSTTNGCFGLHHTGAVVDGFTITRSGMSGVQCEMGTVQNCDISSNRYEGVDCYVLGVVSNCVIRNNDGGLYCEGGRVQNCTITNNISEGLGGIYCNGGEIRNCLICGNAVTNTDWGQGGGIALNGGTIRNCTISGNSAGSQAGGLYVGYYGGVVENTIVGLNSAPVHPNWVDYSAGGPGIAVAFSCASPLMPGIGNVSGEPGFADAAHGDCRLLPGSPCINAGTNQDWMIGAVDLAGNGRVLYGTVDMGCYEFKTNGLVCNLVANRREGFPPLNVTLTAYVAGTNTAGLYYRWDLNNDGTVDVEGYGLTTITTNYLNYGDHSVSLTVSNAAGQTATIVKSDYIRTVPPVMYVSPSGNQTFPFTNWVTASRSIQEAVNQGIDGCVVWVTNGTYTLTSQVTVAHGITVRSVNGRTNTILDGNLANRCFHLADTSAVVDGFTITRGYANGGAGVYCDGGGTVQNCTISNNAAEVFGGGVHCVNGGWIRDSIIASNSACWGGGVCCDGGGTVSNCVVNANVSPRVDQGSGGGIYCYPGGMAVDCTLRDNYSARGGGGLRLWGGAAIRCLIVSNEADWGGGVLGTATGTLDTCILKSNRAAGGGGLLCDGAMIVTKCDISGNTGSNGAGGMDASQSGSIISSCIISNNTAAGNNGYGGGVNMNAGNLMISSTICSNQAAQRGGGVYCNGSAISNCFITGNSATFGGGLNLNGGTLDLCTISGNRGSNGAGGMDASGSSGIIRNCFINNNTAAGDNGYGGGLNMNEGNLIISSTICSNQAAQGGGGVECHYGGRAVDCNISFNSAAWRGGGVDCNYGGVVTNCTIRENTATDGSAGVYCNNGGEVLNSMVAGNRATSSTSTGAGIDCYMGGMVRGCTIVGNTGDAGGGLGLHLGGLAEGCIVSNNVATHLGGGVRFYMGGVASNCVVVGNSALLWGGGGVYFGQGGSMLNSTLAGNQANWGGGAECDRGGQLINCTIQGNTAEGGGGVDFYVTGLVQNCVIKGNYGGANGAGGVSLSQDGRVLNSLICDNYCEGSGGGATLYNGGILENCTIAGNWARWNGGLWCDTGGTVCNTIIYFNAAWEGALDYDYTGESNRFSYTCATPLLTSGLGNTSANPMFMNVALSDYRLRPGSPCINAGTNQDWMIGALDLAGHPRIQDGIVDMGAYESAPAHSFDAWAQAHGLSGPAATVFVQDRDGDGVANGFEYTFGTNWVSGQSVLSIRLVNGRPVVEVPKQDVDTVSYVDLAVKACTNLTSAPDGWTLPVGPATYTVGKPTNCDWYEPLGAPRKAFFGVEATLRPDP